MNGSAATWAGPYLQQIEAHTRDPKKDFPFESSWPKFAEAFKLRFQTTNDAELAVQAINKLKQGNLSVAEYSARFKTLAERGEFSWVDLKDKFKRGLAKEPRDWLANALSVKDPQTLDKLVGIAIKCEFEHKGPDTYRSSNYSYSRPAEDPFAMDIDASRTTPPT